MDGYYSHSARTASAVAYPCRAPPNIWIAYVYVARCSTRMSSARRRAACGKVKSSSALAQGPG